MEDKLNYNHERFRKLTFRALALRQSGQAYETSHDLIAKQQDTRPLLLILANFSCLKKYRRLAALAVTRHLYNFCLSVLIFNCRVLADHETVDKNVDHSLADTKLGSWRLKSDKPFK